MESLGFWKHGRPYGSATAELSQERMMKLGGALQGVVELCCKVANMEGLEMNTLLKRTYETYDPHVFSGCTQHTVTIVVIIVRINGITMITSHSQTMTCVHSRKVTVRLMLTVIA